MAESTIITSQYVQIDQTPAGVGERIFARIVDLFFISVYVVGMVYFIEETRLYNILDQSLFYVVLVILYLPAVFYSFIFESFFRGRSPGKMLFGMRVVMQDGSTPTIGAYLLRWMLLFVDLWMSNIGLIPILVSKNNQRFGDLAAGTVVIKEKDYHRINVSLDEFNYLSRGYHPVYPQAENLSLEQVNLITETLKRFDSNRFQRVASLSAKVKEFLKVTSSQSDSDFLQTLYRDYQYFALEEV